MILKVHSNLKDSMSSKQLICPCKCFCRAHSVSFHEDHQKRSCWIFSISTGHESFQEHSEHTYFSSYLSYISYEQILLAMGLMCWRTRKNQLLKTLVRWVISRLQRIYHKAFIHTFNILPLSHLPKHLCLLQPTHMWRKSMALWTI